MNISSGRNYDDIKIIDMRDKVLLWKTKSGAHAWNSTGYAPHKQHNTTICTIKSQGMDVNKLLMDIKLYFAVPANLIPVSGESHIIKKLFLCKMRTLLEYSFYKL